MAWLLRLLGSLILFRLFSRGRAGMRAKRPAMKRPQINFPVRDFLDDLGVGTRALVVLALAGVALVGTVITTTLLVLGPRFLGAVGAVVTVALIAMTAYEAHKVSRSLAMREWRHRRVVIKSGDEDSFVS